MQYIFIFINKKPFVSLITTSFSIAYFNLIRVFNSLLRSKKLLITIHIAITYKTENIIGNKISLSIMDGIMMNNTIPINTTPMFCKVFFVILSH